MIIKAFWEMVTRLVQVNELYCTSLHSLRFHTTKASSRSDSTTKWTQSISSSVHNPKLWDQINEKETQVFVSSLRQPPINIIFIANLSRTLYDLFTSFQLSFFKFSANQLALHIFVLFFNVKKILTLKKNISLEVKHKCDRSHVLDTFSTLI